MADESIDLKRISALTTEATRSDWLANTFFAVDNASIGTKKLAASILVTILNNFAKEFKSDVACTAGKCYWRDGVLYKCKNAHSGTWSDNDFDVATVDDVYALVQYGTNKINELPDKNEGYFALNDGNGTGKFDVEKIFNNFAGKFVPNSTTTVAGLPYMYNGSMYVAKEDYQGAWDVTKFTKVPLSSISMLFRQSAPSGLSSLSLLTAPGFWAVSDTIISNVNDAPSGVSGYCSLSVIPSVSPYVVQILMTTSGNHFYKRNVNSGDNSATPWISGSLNEYVFRGQVNAELGYTTLKQCRELGFYGETTAGVENITDLPTDYDNTQFFTLCVYPTNGIYNLQVLQSRDMKTWKRLSPAKNQTYPETAWVSDFYKSDVFHGSVYSSLGYTELKQCREYGFYGSITNDLSHITDLPTDYDNTQFFTLMVLPANYEYYNFQFLVSRDNHVWKRLAPAKGSSQNPTSWVRNLELSDIFFGRVYNDLGYTTLKQCIKRGFYGSDTSDLSHITDLPSDYDTTQFFSLSVLPVGTVYNLQVLQSRDMKTWKRLSPAQGLSIDATPWEYTGGIVVGSATKYIALGDSITQGWWSDDNGDYYAPTAGINWPNFVAQINGYSVTNAAVGGSGYARKSNHGEGRNGKDIVDTIDFANYDLVSIAYGVNDWKYVEDLGDMSTSSVGDGTMVGNMRYCIEKILTDNPSIKIVIVGPFNCSIMGGNVAGNWGLGVTLANGTLQDCIDKIKSVCDYYNLQYVDCISNNIVTRLTVPDIFKDGVHPKQDYILKMAKSFAQQLMYS